MDSSKHLKGQMRTALLLLLVALVTAVSVTTAWYIYNTNAHTTKLKMAAGASASLEISNRYDTGYGYSTVLESFVGGLNPVSANKINGYYGFQKVYGFTNGGEGQPMLLANLFGPSSYSDYYHTKLYLRSTGSELQVYLADVGFEDSDENNPISTAIRLGFVMHEPGQNTPIAKEMIFEINTASNPQAEYNTYNGEPGHVLNSEYNDGTTIEFHPYNPNNYCEYDKESDTVILKPNAVPLCSVPAGAAGSAGTPVEVEVYIWLEGCDPDCVKNLGSQTLRNLAMSFSGHL